MKRESSTVDELLAAARAQLDRVDAAPAQSAMADGALLVDIRSDSQRAQDGVVPDATFIPRNVLEWRVEEMSVIPRVARPRAFIPPVTPANGPVTSVTMIEA